MSDALADTTAQLYRLAPEEFVAARDERVKALRTGGEAAAAKQVAALRKPTVGAWLVNLLVADEPGIAAQVSALAEQLRTAQEQLVGADLRALGRQRQELVSGLVARARALARDAGRKVTGSVLDTEVESSLRAALADPDVAREVLSGRLTHATEFAGFGPTPPATSRDRARTPPPGHDREGKPARKATDPTHDHGKGGAAKGSAAQRRRTEQRERAWQEARAKLAEAEQTLVAAQTEHAAAEADAATAAHQVASAGQRLDELRAQLDQAQSELDQEKDQAEQAKWRTRRAAAALRAAQASLGRASDRSDRAER